MNKNLKYEGISYLDSESEASIGEKKNYSKPSRQKAKNYEIIFEKLEEFDFTEYKKQLNKRIIEDAKKGNQNINFIIKAESEKTFTFI